MTTPFDLDAYFARIGFTGPAFADLATLTAIQALHTAAMPFENLNPLLGIPVRLDMESLQAKLIGARRGGYCFEQNAVLAAALGAIGFEVTTLAGRVRWMAPPERPMGPRSHMTLRVDLAEGPYLVDAGFGGHMIAAPLQLMADLEQRQDAGTLRLQSIAPETFMLQTRLPSGWQDMYRFTLEPQYPADYEAANWFTSTHPDSIFLNGLLMERLTPQVRMSLYNRRLIERWSDGRTVERILASAAELGEVLESAFAVTPPAPVAAIWAKLPVG